MAEKMDALKRAYAEMILNTAKEAASRVMASELKARRLEQDLISTKEEAARMLLRLKQMIDRKRNEAEVTFFNQRRKVDELECQLDEAEGIILELRAELNEAQEQLDQAKHRPALSLRQSENGKVSYTAAKDNASGYEQLTELPLSGTELLTDDGKHFRLDKRSPDVNSECHVYSVDSQQNWTPIKEPDMLRNGCAQAVHKTEMNIVSEDLPLGENLVPFDDSTNVENMHIVGSASVPVGNVVPHGKSEDVSVVRRSIRKRKLKHWDEVMSACSHQFKKARLAISPLSCCKSKKVRRSVESGDKLKTDDKTQIGKSLDCVEENPNDELRHNENPPDTDIELMDVLVKQDEHDAMFGLDNASKIDCDVNCAIATEASNPCCDDRERVFKYTFSRKRKDSMIYPENKSSPADSPLRKSPGVKQNGISGFQRSTLLTKSSVDCRGLAQVAHQINNLVHTKPICLVIKTSCKLDATSSAAGPKHTNVSFSIWPPTEGTRDTIRNRLVETLSSTSILSKLYGTLSCEEAVDVAKRIEEEAFESVCATAATDDDGIEILQVYSKEIGKRMLETVKSRYSESGAPVPQPANKPTPKAEMEEAGSTAPPQSEKTESVADDE